MKLLKMKVRNFKSLKNIELDFKGINIFAGGNGVGKSSVIQGLLLAKTTAEQLSEESNHIEINGPYNLELGRTEQILNFSATEDKISLEFQTENKKLNLEYEVDIYEQPHTLTVDNKKTKNIDELNNINFNYIGAERVGPSKAQFFDPQQKLKVGYKGEFTNHVLSRADYLQIDIVDQMKHKDGLERFSTQVEAWMRTIFQDFRLKYKEIKEVDMVSVLYGKEDSNEFIPQTSTGFGITYALPIITAGLLAVSGEQANNILIVENPEAHLHPFGQSRLGRFLALLSLCGVQIIIETHSEHIINGIRLELSHAKNTDNAIINFFHQIQGETINSIISIKENGELTNWPSGFFDQEKQDLFELLKIKRGKLS